MISPNSQQSYVLSEQENQRIFETRIIPDLFADVPTQPNPQLTIVMAQPGAGKTTLCESFVQPAVLEFGAFAQVDSDLYKPYHPEYQKIMAEKHEGMATLLGPDGRNWMRQAYDHTRRQRMNVITQEPVYNPGFLFEEIQKYRESGFGVSVVALAVSEAVSRQGILERYARQVQESGKGRLSSGEKIQRSLSGMAVFATMLGDVYTGLVDEITIVRRNGDNTTKLQPTTRSFASDLDAEQARQLSPQESQSFLDKQSMLEEQLGPVWRPELTAIRELARPILDQTTALGNSL